MKIKFLRNYGEYKIGDIAEFDGEELEYIVNTLTAVSVEDGFESDEIEEEQGAGVMVVFNSEDDLTDGLSEQEIEERAKKTLEEDPELEKGTSKRAKKGEK
mgnify:FL=1